MDRGTFDSFSAISCANASDIPASSSINFLTIGFPSSSLYIFDFPTSLVSLTIPDFSKVFHIPCSVDQPTSAFFAISVLGRCVAHYQYKRWQFLSFWHKFAIFSWFISKPKHKHFWTSKFNIWQGDSGQLCHAWLSFSMPFLWIFLSTRLFFFPTISRPHLKLYCYLHFLIFGFMDILWLANSAIFFHPLLFHKFQ